MQHPLPPRPRAQPLHSQDPEEEEEEEEKELTSGTSQQGLLLSSGCFSRQSFASDRWLEKAPGFCPSCLTLQEKRARGGRQGKRWKAAHPEGGSSSADSLPGSGLGWGVQREGRGTEKKKKKRRWRGCTAHGPEWVSGPEP